MCAEKILTLLFVEVGLDYTDNCRAILSVFLTEFEPVFV